MKKYGRKMRFTAWLLIITFTFEAVFPITTVALTTGPTQPEVMGFEPVGTTDMVDMFTGDFTYNIPLLDVEGYPVNIAYHGGVGMEDEASWVGLGWNINPGEVNRTVRGLPDDFNGDVVEKSLHIKDEYNVRMGLGVGVEIVGAGDPLLSLTASLGACVNVNNYKGVSCDIDYGVGLNLWNTVSVGVNLGVGSQSGADVDYNVSISGATSHTINKLENNVGVGVSAALSHGYSTRSGVKDLNLTYSARLSSSGFNRGGINSRYSSAISSTNTIPISVHNYVPVVTNSSWMTSVFGRIKFGVEAFWMYGYATVNGKYSRLHFNGDGSRESFGYLYMQNAQKDYPGNTSILDFTRDKDGMFNRTMSYLPPANMCYDIYTVSGHGTGGMFRSFRNDFGSVYDPVTSSQAESNSFGLEAGIPGILEVGCDYTSAKTEISSRPWSDFLRSFVGKRSNSIYEDVYLKEGGELTSVNPSYNSTIRGVAPLDPSNLRYLPSIKPNSGLHRDARGNLIYYFTASEASTSGIGIEPSISNYVNPGFASGPQTPAPIARVGANPLERKEDQISCIEQLQKDGRRFIYGLPAINHIQKEVTFSVSAPLESDRQKGMVSFSPTDESDGNGQGRDNYYSSSLTPSYAHSYLLTSVLSADYVDITGNGVTDDDLGSYTKFNYTKKENDYRWRAPFDSGKAQYDQGFVTEPGDDKGSFVCGSREQWLLHSIETRNYVAEFYTSKRNDACGSQQAIATNSTRYNISPYNTRLDSPAKSYQLDSIKLYNKHDRFLNRSNAVPIKGVYFVYTDTLCRGIPNTLNRNPLSGKLTLTKIYFSYGSSNKSLMSPYQFEYGMNPNYDVAAKDRWGNYKPNDAGFPNYLFPFINQDDPNNNLYASAWSLTKIYLPSGGLVEASYESDDYAFVQDKTVNEMFPIAGIGNGTNFNPSDKMYVNKKNPNCFIYFKRSPAREKAGLGFAENYIKNNDIIYYNFRVKIAAQKNKFEPIKGYAKIESSGICPDNSSYGYIKFVSVTPSGGDAYMNPVCYTAINTARYELPQVMYPGSDPDLSDFKNVLAGLKGALGELLGMFNNPIVRFVKMGYARDVELAKSFIRLQSPGLKKKGGGQRVKSLKFHDNWNALAGGNEQPATFGKNYDYTIDDDQYGTISSGVASYEPLIGGDENPLRQPIPYEVQRGSNFPPNDAVGLYQETPIGESLYPTGRVGYRKVTVSSIHADVGKSAQAIDAYQFYTARDFPVKFYSTAIGKAEDHNFSFFEQNTSLTATQGYSLVLNDMHGKPKSVEHYVRKFPGAPLMTISYQKYNYKSEGNSLNNTVPCFVPSGPSGMTVQNMQLGVETDVTIDTRQKEEKTKTRTFNVNLNVSVAWLIVIPIPFAFPWGVKNNNAFFSATTTKVVQQYGILESVESFNEAALTKQTNEVFDPETGQVLVSSINNEFQQKEYSTTIPAYWINSGMGGAYQNIHFEKDIDTIRIDTNRMGRFVGGENLQIGDELLLRYNGSSSTVAYVMKKEFAANTSTPNVDVLYCMTFVLPKYPTSTAGWAPGWVAGNHLKVIRSGHKNLLTVPATTLTSLDRPIQSDNKLKYNYDQLISLSAVMYTDSNTAIMGRYINRRDTINPFSTGERGLYRAYQTYSYLTPRSYSGLTSRRAGTFSGSLMYVNNFTDNQCLNPYNYLRPIYPLPTNWKVGGTVTKWSPYGAELENRDAVGNYSTAVFGYNDDLPVAIAANAKQGDVFFDGFEDYNVLKYTNSLSGFAYSPFASYFGTNAVGSSPYSTYSLVGTSGFSIVKSKAHTGDYCLLTPGTPNGSIAGMYNISLPISNRSYATVRGRSNPYYPYSSYYYSAANEYISFKLATDKKYILSCWIKRPGAVSGIITDYALHDSTGVRTNLGYFPYSKKSNIIEGWQLVEIPFTVSSATTYVTLRLPVGLYVDDIRAFPADANMKSMVYHPFNEKLVATLDENNFATFYEYDQEGNLVRVKKETEKGVMTVSESRSNTSFR